MSAGVFHTLRMGPVGGPTRGAIGGAIFLHGHKRKMVDNVIRPPGLYLLCRSCSINPTSCDIPGLAITSETQRVIPAASLSLAEGEEVVAVRKEEVIR